VLNLLLWQPKDDPELLAAVARLNELKEKLAEMSKPVETNPFVKQRPELDDVAKVVDLHGWIFWTLSTIRSALIEESFSEESNVASDDDMFISVQRRFFYRPAFDIYGENFDVEM
jgi:hypothetical protein